MNDKRRTQKVHETMINTYMSIFGVSREDAIAALQARGLIPNNDDNTFDIADWDYDKLVIPILRDLIIEEINEYDDIVYPLKNGTEIILKNLRHETENLEEILKPYIDEKLEDAKLSTKKRKKLKSSTFCGPDRSFPVPDCAHVAAARRLIGRAKGLSATQKQSILSCVARKAKKLGCKSSKKEKK